MGETEATTFVQPYPPTGVKYQVGRAGRPLWSTDGKELTFVPAPGHSRSGTRFPSHAGSAS